MNYYLVSIMLIIYIIIMGKMVARHIPFIYDVFKMQNLSYKVL